MPIEPRQKTLWLYELNLHGFILFRDFLPRDFIETMAEQLRPLLAGEIARVARGDDDMARGPQRLSFDIREYVELLKGPLDDALYRRNPVIEELVSAVMSEWRYGVAKVECPLKGSEMMVWHPDMPEDPAWDSERPRSGRRLTFNVPLVDITPEMGPMQLIPGSHRMVHREYSDLLNALPTIHSQTIILNRGDAMLRDGNILHRGTPNLTEQPRILLDQTYRIVDGRSGAAGRTSD